MYIRKSFHFQTIGFMQEDASNVSGSSSAPISPKAGSNDDSGANSSYSSSSSLKQEKTATRESKDKVVVEEEENRERQTRVRNRTESAEADKTSLPPSKTDIDSVSVVTTAASIANPATSS